MKPHDFIPKNKFDTQHIEDLYTLDNEIFSVIAYQLLEWIQDMNWPIAQKLVPVLILRQDLVIEAIHRAFNTNDDLWKYWILLYLIPELSNKNYASILPRLTEIHKQPSASEVLEEVYMEIDLLLKKRIIKKAPK